jgi:hypothetical protein
MESNSDRLIIEYSEKYEPGILFSFVVLNHNTNSEDPQLFDYSYVKQFLNLGNTAQLQFPSIEKYESESLIMCRYYKINE